MVGPTQWPQGLVQCLPHPLAGQGQSVTLLWSPGSPLLLPCHPPGEAYLSVYAKRGCFPLSPALPPPLKDFTAFPFAPGPPMSLDRICLPQQSFLKTEKMGES